MTLRDRLLERIAASGPISLADYMAEALLHPTLGYYTTRDPLGAEGDFITAPEISQMFGEMLGLALAQAWLDQGAPAPITLAELGPGRGTLMADALRATRGVPGFHAAARLNLVEVSPTFRAAQQRALKGFEVTHLDTADALPDAPLFVIANEFFDALPIRQFQRGATGWAERQVGARDGALFLGLGAEADQPALAHRLDDTRPGDVVEHCAAAPPVMAAIGARIAARGGAALILDYGDWRSLGDTFQALQGHDPVDPLACPGQADLTAHVDFEALARAAGPAAHTRLTTQGVFLERLGITQRAQALARTLTGPALDAHVAAHRRLTHPDEMGSLFKVLGVYPGTAPPPTGLEP
ncbi:SAM-dependent methyltransferase [Lutimaribacter sp. EGI FJ00015]|uniref:SAM-dependent methyltransferase n=1 Tax=Lutimaribacter degradans TaxID=2945989 RepID=A0ACC6A0K2_9RHOB|nr:SAM-dependent methyltransferase [Lutimaribacter sp. EGI FJ00013]MCM2563304.1 SAM-dependent methyltransferase [Lutimaribacter sp. EGI FJ00013]MCO0614373.1 SAM-dependent methyltransferase [Lutimaribacter sp. EGI FJ00015]MCO0636026.1 SAM-dependent methyltransferase [Lutimaribacter sp. EGI FJ00014]